MVYKWDGLNIEYKIIRKVQFGTGKKAALNSVDVWILSGLNSVSELYLFSKWY